jgi:hypothetical protein
MGREQVQKEKKSKKQEVVAADGGDEALTKSVKEVKKDRMGSKSAMKEAPGRPATTSRKYDRTMLVCSLILPSAGHTDAKSHTIAPGKAGRPKKQADSPF